jgi:hypothetical protein
MGCKGEEGLPGMTLRFECTGSAPIVVVKFQPEGMRNMPAGALGCGPGKFAEMAFMPGDVKGRSPTYVEVEWVEHTQEYRRWSAEQSKRTQGEQYSERGRAEYREQWSKLPRFSGRIELAAVIRQDILAQVRADRNNTQLKLTIHFQGGAVTATAEAYKWR